MYNHSSMTFPAMPVMTMGGNNCNDGFGFGGGWWAFMFMAMMWGWGGNGNWGWNRGGNSFDTQSIDASLQRGFDTQTIINKLDGINNGLCSLGYDQLNQMNGINQNISNTGYNLERAITQGTISDMQSFNALQALISSCCCENRQGQADIKYAMASNTCDLKTLITQAVQQLQWGQQTGLRDLTDLINNQFCQLRSEQKDNIIADLRSQLNNCGRDNALQSLYQQLINTLQPTAVPAYPSCNPRGVGNWAASVLSGNGCGFNNNCSCNNNC